MNLDVEATKQKIKDLESLGRNKSMAISQHCISYKRDGFSCRNAGFKQKQ